MIRAKLIWILTFMISFSGSGQSHDESIEKLANQPRKIIIFMAVDCPVTQKYVSTIKSLALRYQNQISILGYFPAGLSRQSEREFRRGYNIPDLIELVDDKSHKMTKKLGASITPQAFLLSLNDEVLYSGAIDNWFFELGRYRPEVTENYLIDAVAATLNQTPPPVTKTKAIGCFIQMKKQDKHHHQH
jgi:hypothetical protein